MKKIIFLDIDGVLNITELSNNTYMKTGLYMEEHLIKLFNDFLDDNKDISLVISSDWRMDMDDLKDQLHITKFKHNNRIIGATGFEDWRGNEIQTYINTHLKKEDKYCVLDDNMYFICGDSCDTIDKKYCVQTDTKIGITKQSLLDISKILS